VSHRFSSVRSADRVFVLGGGRLVEQGTHEQLMARGGQYAELFAMQAEAYLSPAAEAQHGPAPAASWFGRAGVTGRAPTPRIMWHGS